MQYWQTEVATGNMPVLLLFHGMVSALLLEVLTGREMGC